jgi:hypothetical protein
LVSKTIKFREIFASIVFILEIFSSQRITSEMIVKIDKIFVNSIDELVALFQAFL